MLFRRMLADGGCALQMRRSAAEGRGDPRGGCGAGATPVVYSAMYVGAGALVATFVALRRTPGLAVPRVRKRNRCSVRSGADRAWNARACSMVLTPPWLPSARPNASRIG